jgi:hypothetical protein
VWTAAASSSSTIIDCSSDPVAADRVQDRRDKEAAANREQNRVEH